MIFQHTWEKVLSGEKTQTRRIVKPGDYSVPADIGFLSVWHNDTRKWQVWHDYAVQPGRGKPAVARIRITDIRREDVREISWEDARAEGFSGEFQFLWVWTSMHDKAAMNACKKTDFSDGDESGYVGHPQGWMSWLKGQRTAERYQAWVIGFELVR